MHLNKIHLIVRNDKNGWYMFTNNKHKGGKNYRLQLCGDSRKGGFFLKQYADKCGKPDFMKDLTDILEKMAEDKVSAFSLYELE